MLVTPPQFPWGVSSEAQCGREDRPHLGQMGQQHILPDIPVSIQGTGQGSGLPFLGALGQLGKVLRESLPSDLY